MDGLPRQTKTVPRRCNQIFQAYRKAVEVSWRGSIVEREETCQTLVCRGGGHEVLQMGGELNCVTASKSWTNAQVI